MGAKPMVIDNHTNNPMDAEPEDGSDETSKPGTEHASPDERRRYLRLSDRDAALLRSLRRLVREHAEEIVQGFYEHLLSNETTRLLLRDEATVERLMNAQRDYLDEMFSGVYDDVYCRRKVQIGKVHDRIGLKPTWYLGAYHLYQRLLFPIIGRHLKSQGRSDDEVIDALLAVTKIMMFDMDLALEAYFGAYNDALVQERDRLRMLSSEQQQTNAQLFDLTNRLEEMVEVRTAELVASQEQVRESETMAAIGKMASMMAHEIRNPLSSVVLNLELLSDELNGYADETDDAKQLLRSVLAQIQRVDGTVRDYLAIARPPKAHLSPNDVNTIVREQVAFLNEELRRSNIETHLDLAADLPPVELDAEEFRQVLLNLAKNSLAAMPNGGDLIIRTSRTQGEVMIEVRDTGIGIPADVREYVFQPLFTTKDKGLGMGLAYVHQAILGHRGRIDLDSEEGVGTIFTLRLPIPS